MVRARNDKAISFGHMAIYLTALTLSPPIDFEVALAGADDSHHYIVVP